MINKPIVYIASPYTKGDQALNTRAQMIMFDLLMDTGIVWPVAPLLTHFQHLSFPRKYQDWIDYDLALIPRYDACLRMQATCPPLNYYENESSGADGEVALFISLGKPVFYSYHDCIEWAETMKES